MSTTFLRRTFRNVVLRDHPYFAHLAITHRCNLRCRFCRVQETRFEELDTEGIERVIDVLDGMGVAVLSLSGGGEPLLRRDVAAILNYAAAKGMYTKITSNGTMPEERYRSLLESSVKEIAISLDGVEGNDLPFSHVGPRILETIRYLHDHLPPGKQLTLNVTVTRGNRERLAKIVAYCAGAFPKAKVWLNPVVSGAGRLRTLNEPGIDPGYLRQCQSPTLLSAEFYTAGAEEQHRNPHFDWGCRAGRMFFDVKPNGDFWICQDHPAQSPMNVLAPDFREQLRRADFSHRRRCGGCTYSCYYLTQKGFEPRNWPGMAGLWWKANTRPDEECRVVAERYGWFLGLLSFCASRIPSLAARAATTAMLALTVAAGSLTGQCASTPPDAAQVLARMEQYHASQREGMASYQSTRRYVAGNTRLGVRAEVTAAMSYTAPGEKTFTVLSRSGSRSVQKTSTSAPPQSQDTEISRRNEATCAIQSVAGEPAQSPSFWVKRARLGARQECGAALSPACAG